MASVAPAADSGVGSPADRSLVHGLYVQLGRTRVICLLHAASAQPLALVRGYVLACAAQRKQNGDCPAMHHGARCDSAARSQAVASISPPNQERKHARPELSAATTM